MKFVIVGNNKHQKPTKGAKGVCPVCGEEALNITRAYRVENPDKFKRLSPLCEIFLSDCSTTP